MEIDRLGSGELDLMMIDYSDDFRVLYAVHDLGLFVMVDQKDPVPGDIGDKLRNRQIELVQDEFRLFVYFSGSRRFAAHKFGKNDGVNDGIGIGRLVPYYYYFFHYALYYINFPVFQTPLVGDLES